jgi:CRP-like cAMP-binding protein
MTDQPALSGLPLLAGLTDEATGALESASRFQRLQNDQTLFEQGGEPRDLYLVTRGRLALRVADAAGRWTTVQSVEAPDLLGWSALRENAHWLTTAAALGPVEVIAVPLAAILDVIERGGPDARLLAQRLFGVGAAHLEGIRAQLQQPVVDPVITGG